ncbi:MAG: transketolase C-terminal domain-containing protein [Bacteroidota bacterium]|jgi:transketolase|nr:transketolase C-terminal domain-containing protein [Bacteroidota bacterium]
MAKATRVSFGEQLVELGATHPNVVVFDADLSKSTQSQMFASAYPARFFEMGIQEHNMIGAAAGMALSGKRPFICSFSTFVVGRFEVIRMSIGYSEANVVVVGTHCGVAIGEDGYSQMALEDIALMRTLPNMTIIQPADDREAKAAVRFLADHAQPAFLRLTRQGLEDIHDDSYRFEFGKADVLRDGSDAVIFATGGVVYHSLRAAEELAAEGLNIRVVNIHTIAPLDVDYIVRAARETGRVITVEDHSIVGGLGGAVAEVLGERQPTLLKRIGMTEYGRSGTPTDLYVHYGLDTDGIRRQVADFLKD